MKDITLVGLFIFHAPSAIFDLFWNPTPEGSATGGKNLLQCILDKRRPGDWIQYYGYVSEREETSGRKGTKANIWCFQNLVNFLTLHCGCRYCYCKCLIDWYMLQSLGEVTNIFNGMWWEIHQTRWFSQFFCLLWSVFLWTPLSGWPWLKIPIFCCS